jgi:glycosyltransferase involved in cell wall biosynthesis
MNILYLTAEDVRGQKFNGYSLHKALRKLGHDSHMAVERRCFDEPEIHQIGSGMLRLLDQALIRIEYRLALHSVLPISAFSLYTAPYYRHAGILHLQLPHATRSFLSLLHLPIMSRQHRFVWTMHDPWLMAGHCIYPLNCERWMTGCGSCPDLGLQLPIKRDTTAFTWRLKNWVMHHSKITLVVASQWMQERVQRSPILSHLPCYCIPFGLDPQIFRPRSKAAGRARLGIPADATVIAFRAGSTPRNVKGTEYIEKALARFYPAKLTCFITFEGKGGLASLRGRFPFVELGWVTDQDLLADALAAADIFLMPSTAEAFGMMAIEAMACGTPVVVFEGTALPEVVHAPRGGIAVPYGDSEALGAAIEMLLTDRARYQALVENGLEIVRQEYTQDLYLKRHIDLYENLLAQPL